MQEGRDGVSLGEVERVMERKGRKGGEAVLGVEAGGVFIESSCLSETEEMKERRCSEVEFSLSLTASFLFFFQNNPKLRLCFI